MSRRSHAVSPRIGRSRRSVSHMVAAVFMTFAAQAHATGDEAKPASAVSAGPAPAVAPASPSPQVQQTSRIEITSTASSWDNLSELFLGSTPAAPFGEGSVFVMRGELRNKGDAPVRYVVLRYELLDDKGNVLENTEGYNRAAEAMRPDEEGHAHPADVKSIPAGGVDSYRMVFFHDEVPRFSSQRVRVAEVHMESE